jgi:hypothetical protein
VLHNRESLVSPRNCMPILESGPGCITWLPLINHQVSEALSRVFHIHGLNLTCCSRGTAGLHFMVKTGVEKFDPESRKLIRSHVMMGKNLGKKLEKPRSPRKRREPKVAVRKELSSSSSSSLDGGQVRSSPSTSPSTVSASKSHTVLQPPATVPHKFASDASTICFADVVEPGTVEVVLKCEWSPAISVGANG